MQRPAATALFLACNARPSAKLKRALVRRDIFSIANFMKEISHFPVENLLNFLLWKCPQWPTAEKVEE